MTFELRKNGSIEIHLTAEDDIERAYVASMLRGAELGRKIRVEPATKADTMVVCLEKA